MSDTYTFTSVTRVTPSGGTIAGGTAVTITGFGFDFATGGVTFGGGAATSFVVVSNTRITAVTPSHNVGAVDVIVAGVGTGVGLYTYSNPSTQLMPRVPVTADYTLDIYGAPKWLMEAKRRIEQAPLVDSGSIIGPLDPDQIPQLPFTRITMSSPRLLGRTTDGEGDAEEIEVAGGLSLSGGVLSMAGLPTGFVIGDLLYAVSATQLATLADVAVGSYLRSGGVATAPLWSTLKLPNAVTAGSVVFASATDTYGQDNANLFWDDTNNKLGIGTPTPKRPLHVNDGGDAPDASLLPGAVVALLTGAASGTLQGVAASSVNFHLPGLYLRSVRSGGTLSAPTIVSAGMLIGLWGSEAYNGTSRYSVAEIGMVVEDVVATDISGYIQFLTMPLGGLGSLVERVRIDSIGRLGVGTTSPTAFAHIKAGTTAAGTAPLKLTSGPLLTAPEAGAIEFLTDAYYATMTTGPTRKTFAFLENGQALTRVDDTNVTLTLGGSPTTALLAATSMTLGWTGTLSVARGGTGTGTALTAGSVVFAGASGVYSQDNANFFWDDSANFLGLGANASLAARLHIKGAGTTLSTVSLLTEDSGGTDTFAIRDDSSFGFGKDVTLPSVTAFSYIKGNAGFSGNVTITNNTNGNNNPVNWMLFQLRFAGNQEFGRAGGIEAIVESSNTHSGNVLVAYSGSARIATASGLATDLVGGSFNAKSDGATSGTVTTIIGARVSAEVNHASVTATSAYGLRVIDLINLGTITNTYGLYIGDVTAGTQTNQAYGIYQVDTGARNYLGGTLELGGKNTTYNSIVTAGWGHPAIYGSARSTAQTAAVASVAAYTVGAADGTFVVSMNINVTTSTAHSFTAECAYTDETNAARVLTITFSQLSGVLVTAITNVTGAGPYEGVPMHIRCKSATSITLRTQAAGTYTTVTYNVEGSIVQVA